MKKTLIALLSIFVSICHINAQIISTIAGIGSSSYSGEGGPATAASLIVHDVCADQFGNVYIVAREDNRVCKVDVAGIITTVAGGGSVFGDGGPATAAQLNDPNDVAVDNMGNIYISDGPSNRIRKVNTLGIINTIAGTGTAGFSGDGSPATAAMINDAYGIKVDDFGTIYFADAYNNRIRKIDTLGIITTLAGTGGSGLSFGDFSGDSGPATDAHLNDPTSICIDASGNLIFTDGYNNRLRKIDAAGIITTIAGSGPYGAGTGSFSGDSGAATAATLNYAFGVTIDGCGNIFIADAYNNRIRKINSAGIITTIAGISGPGGFGGDGSPATGATLYVPCSVSLGIANDLFIADAYNNRARRITNVTINAGKITGIDSVCHGHTVSLSDSIPGGIWSSSNTLIATVTSGGLVTAGVPGADTIIYTVTSSDCSLEAIFPFRVNPPSICNTETPLIPGRENEKINIYPNPAFGKQFTVDIFSAKNEDAEIIVYNLLGEKIKTKSAKTNVHINIDLEVPDGIYIITATTHDNKWNERILINSL